MKIPEENCLEKLHAKTKDIALFRELFDSYFRTLTTYAYRFVGDWQTAEDITQDVFTSLWEKKENIDFDDPIKPYLYRAVYNRSINYLNSALTQKRIEAAERDYRRDQPVCRHPSAPMQDGLQAEPRKEPAE